MSTKNHIGIIGGGFAGLSAASILAKQHNKVTLFAKNAQIGGRARQFNEAGYTFDMGPSWYWMPDVFERFYNQFGYTTSDFYELKKLEPNFKMIFSNDNYLDIPSNWEELLEMFENLEKGAGLSLKKFMDEAKFKYDKSMQDLIYSPGESVFEFARLDIIRDSFKLQLFSSFRKHVRSHFSNPELIALMEFPILFLGAMPKDTPALYSMMNYSGLVDGTFYPMGGFGKVKEALKKVASEQGVEFKLDKDVKKINVESNAVSGIDLGDEQYSLNGIIGASDYHHIEMKLLDKKYRNYDENYWDRKVFAPSCLLFYLGVNKKVPSIEHHNLFFDKDYELHAKEIYQDKKWPTDPLFYVCAPSKTDSSVAPEGHENLFILVPIAPGCEDTRELRAQYYDMVMDRLESFCNFSVRDHIDFKRSYCVRDFENDYNAYKGNAYGLANTLMQTAIFKPKLRNKRVRNLYYAGQLTVPGPGVPPSLISGEIAAKQLMKNLNF